MNPTPTKSELEAACADLPRIDAFLASLDQQETYNPGSPCRCFMAQYVRQLHQDVWETDHFVAVSTIHITIDRHMLVRLSGANGAWQEAMLYDPTRACGYPITVARARELLVPYLITQEA